MTLGLGFALEGTSLLAVHLVFTVMLCSAKSSRRDSSITGESASCSAASPQQTAVKCPMGHLPQLHRHWHCCTARQDHCPVYPVITVQPLQSLSSAALNGKLYSLPFLPHGVLRTLLYQSSILHPLQGDTFRSWHTLQASFSLPLHLGAFEIADKLNWNLQEMGRDWQEKMAHSRRHVINQNRCLCRI